MKIQLYAEIDDELCSESCPFFNIRACELFNVNIHEIDNGNGIQYKRCEQCIDME